MADKVRGMNDPHHRIWQKPGRHGFSVDVAIIGGGVSGALTAYHLLWRRAVRRVAIIDPRQALGLGLAYSTPSMGHLLNVPAGKISCLPDQPDHFLNWLKENFDADASADTFVPRAVFGEYVRWLIEPLDGLKHVRAKAIDCVRSNDGMAAMLDNGQRILAKRVVLATGNFDPAPLLGISPAAVERGIYRHNAWDSATYQDLHSSAPLTLIGTGLTAVDVLLRLRESGHRGIVTAVSRHGWLPHRHESCATLNQPVIPAETAPTCLAYLRAIRAAIDAGTPWRSAIDSLRETSNALWLALPLEEQRRFRRHLQRRWDVVRHRMAPRIAETIDREKEAGTLVIRQGRFSGVEMSSDGGAIVRITGSNGLEEFPAAGVINCTGPSLNYRKVNSPLLKKLFSRGLIRTGPHGTGLLSDSRGALIDANGNASTKLFTIGPSRLGTLIESIAVPELRQQAADLAMTLSGSARPMASAQLV